MPRGRTRAVKNLPSESSDDDEPLSKLYQSHSKETEKNDDSSSESDIENYLHPADKIDLDSPFFNIQKGNDASSFDKIEGKILTGVNTLNDSESEDETSPLPQDTPSTSKLNFGQLHEYTKKIEEAKRQVEEYNARRQAKEKEINIEKILAAGESNLSDEKRAILEATLHSSDFDSGSDSEKETWEEVKEPSKEKTQSKEGLQITVDIPGVPKKKKDVDLMAAIKRRINRIRKDNQLLVHKVHLLCWIAHGNYLSSQINSQNVLGIALSLLPSQQCYPADRTDLNYLEQVLKWYRSTVENVEQPVPPNKTFEELLQAQIIKKESYNKKMLVLIFIAIMRSLGIQCRLVLSFQVETLRPPSSELHSLSTKIEPKPGTSKSKKQKTKDEKSASEVKSRPKSSRPKHNETNLIKSSTSKPRSNTTLRAGLDAKAAKEIKNRVSNSKNSTKESKSRRSQGTSNTTIRIDYKDAKTASSRSTPKKVNESSKSKTSTPVKNSDSKSKPEQIKNSRKLRSKKESSIPQLDGANDSNDSSKPNLRKLKQKGPPLKRPNAVPKYADSDSENDLTPTRTPFSAKKNFPNLKKLKTNAPKGLDVRDDIVNLMKKRIKEQKHINRSKTVKKRKKPQDTDEDSDYVAEVIKTKHHDSDDELAPKVKVKKRVQVKPDPEEGKVKKKKGLDVWAEVFLETEEKWISVDVVKGQIHSVKELYNRASHPVSYIVAWNNNNSLKDITARYCTNFNTVTRKLRIDPKWWEASLKPFVGHPTIRDKEEDDELERQQLEKPLPTVVSEYKNHPLYALKRHLLKFEAIYPPDAPTLGFVRNEPVYSRACIYTLHSREIWLKHAKVVKPGEQPYKIVKARPKWDKLSNKMITDQMLEVFGVWQTQDYEPPTAENGIVPRNAFGNVELFKPCMLPKKCVHLILPGLNKIAKRMNIDCAAAVVGFDFHGGWNHPTYDGFIVCEEYADALVAAWEIDREEQIKKEREKIDKRVYGNWRKLIRGLLIRERLKRKYEFGTTSGEKEIDEKDTEQNKKKGKTSNKKRKMNSGSD